MAHKSETDLTRYDWTKAERGKYAARRRSGKRAEPSKASLAEMPEIDFSKVGKPSRGKYAERARCSLEVIVLDKKLVAALGGPDRIVGILRAVADAVSSPHPPGPLPRRRASQSGAPAQGRGNVKGTRGR